MVLLGVLCFIQPVLQLKDSRVSKNTTQRTMSIHTILPRCEGKLQKTVVIENQRIYPPSWELTVGRPDLVTLHEAIIDERL